MNFQIIKGDVNEIDLPRLAHALLTDPPYHLESIVKRFGKPESKPAQHGKDGAFGRVSRGFMQKEWDGGDVAFRADTWHTILSQLHPGGFGVAFSSAKLFHRMMVAIEDGGAVMHPMIGWTYSCLSDDTEVLTEEGWKVYSDLSDQDRVACWDKLTEAIHLEVPERVHIYPYTGHLLKFKNRDTDQLVTPNHRMLHKKKKSSLIRENKKERWHSDWVFDYASDISRASQQVFPLGGYHSGIGIGGSEYASLLAWVFTEGGYSNGDNGIRIYQSSVNMDCVEEIRRILSLTVTKFNEYTREREYNGRKYTEFCWYFNDETAKWVKRWLPGKKPTWELLWSMNYDEKISFREASILGDGGPKGEFYQKDLYSREWMQALFHLTGHKGTDNSSKKLLNHSFVNTTEFSVKSLRLNQSEFYDGNVWCLTVSTGAFMVRRNGKIFITGNSGFPKATRIDTQVDKMAGAERLEVPNPLAAKQTGQVGTTSLRDRNQNKILSLPSSPLAQVWAGHRYGQQALAPALEPIAMFQRPYEGKPLLNIIETGAGALWIDGGRIGSSPEKGGNKSGVSAIWDSASSVVSIDRSMSAGRWPKNLLLQHLPSCTCLGETEETYTINAFDDDMHPFGDAVGEEYSSSSQTVKVLVWQCEEGCPVRQFAEINGVKKSGLMTPAHHVTHEWSYHGGERAKPTFTSTYADEGTVDRFFYQTHWAYDVFERMNDVFPALYFAKASKSEKNAGLDAFIPQTVSDGREKSIDNPFQRGEIPRKNVHPSVKPLELTRYLASLLLPSAHYAPRTLYVPFSGSGSEMIGGLLAGFEEVIGVELDTDNEYIPIATARLEFWKWAMNHYGPLSSKEILRLVNKNKPKANKIVIENNLPTPLF